MELEGPRKAFLIESLLRQSTELFVAASQAEEWIFQYLSKDQILKTDTYNSVRLLGDVLAFAEERNIRFGGIGTFWEHTVTQTARCSSGTGPLWNTTWSSAEVLATSS